MKKDIIYKLSTLEDPINNLESFPMELRPVLSLFSIIFDAFNSTSGGILITDGTGKIVFANPAFLKMFQFNDFNELSQLRVANLFQAEEIQTLFDVKKIIDSSQSSEFSALNKNGESFFVEVSCSDIVKHDQIIGRIGSFFNISKRKKLEADRERLINELKEALSQIKTLKGLVPICSYCKKIRDDEGYWNQLESYISEHTDALFSHGICPECLKSQFPDFAKDMGKTDQP